MADGLKTNRIEALCDGIFAIAMTLLVVGFNEMATWPRSMNEDELSKQIIGILPDIAYYLQSFIIIGAFWIEHHHQFHYIKQVNLTLLFINICAFMFIALLPFTTLIVGDYGRTRTAAIFFESNLFFAGLFFYIHWVYATKKAGITDSHLDRKIIAFYSRKNMVIPIASLIAIGISIINPQASSAVYFAVPFIILLQRGK